MEKKDGLLSNIEQYEKDRLRWSFSNNTQEKEAMAMPSVSSALIERTERIESKLYDGKWKSNEV
eukprot:scaffold10096_cov49-Cyclotella_meneghiniana.AAC.3